MEPILDPGTAEELSAKAIQQVESMRTMFGTPRISIAPVLNGSTPDSVVANPRIAIVDDDPINIKVLQKHLKLAGYRQFFTTTDSREAVGMIRAQEPDVVLLDIMMPHVSGLDILRELRGMQSFVDLPIVILTAASDRETKLEAVRLGATEFLTKPVDTVELEARLRNLLALKAHRDRIRQYTWELEIEVAARAAELADAHREVVQCLALVGEYRDNETSHHTLRVGRYAEIMALRLGLGPIIAARVRDAAALHDIGKVGIPDAILLKPGKLDAAEWAIMQRHCEKGRSICSPRGDDPDPVPELPDLGDSAILGGGNSPILRLAASITYTHHERWDGSGYPRGLAGEAIPIEGRIAAVADVFDALVSNRPYKSAMPLGEAIELIRKGRGTHFDPAVVDAFLAGMDEIVNVHRTLADASFPRESRADGLTARERL